MDEKLILLEVKAACRELKTKYPHIIDERDIQNLALGRIIHKIVSYYEDIITCMPGNVYWLNTDCTALGCNKNVSDMFGLNSPEEFKGYSFEDMGKRARWSKEAEQRFKNDTLEVIRTGKAKLNIEEPPITHANGKVIYFLTSRVPLFDSSGRIIGVVGISVDITDLKDAQKVVENAKLHEEQIDSLKKAFIRNMEHDIRTPFSGVYGFAQIMADAETDPEKKANLIIISDCAKQLLDYCNEILKFDAVEIEKEFILERKFALKKILQNVYEMQHPAAIIKNLTLSIQVDETLPKVLIGDNTRLFRILINLVSNAIKFTEKGEVKISVKIGKQVSEKEVVLRFFVEDTGIGIAPDKKQLIYEKFVRLHPSNKGKYQGFGLGLWMVKQFITDLQGEIEVKSKEGEGTIFICTIPFKLPLIDDILDED